MALQTQSNKRKTYRRARDNVFAGIFLSSVVVGVLVLAWLLIEVFVDSFGWLDWQFLSSYSSRHPVEAGVLAPIAGTFWVIILTAVMTVPVGIATAVYLEEFAPNNRVTRLIQLNISNLAGVPSVVYGLLGLAIFVQYLFDGQRSLLAGALTLSLLGHADRDHCFARGDPGSSSQLPRRRIRDGCYTLAGREDGGAASGDTQHDVGHYSRDVTGDRRNRADLGREFAGLHHLRPDVADRPLHRVAIADRYVGIATPRRLPTHCSGGYRHPVGDVADDERGGDLHQGQVPAPSRVLGLKRQIVDDLGVWDLL